MAELGVNAEQGQHPIRDLSALTLFRLALRLMDTSSGYHNPISSKTRALSRYVK